METLQRFLQLRPVAPLHVGHHGRNGHRQGIVRMVQQTGTAHPVPDKTFAGAVSTTS